jgi:WXG100 family type VII secretion target
MGQAYGALSRAAALVGEARGDLGRLEGRVVSQLAAAESRWAGQGSVAFQSLGRAWSDRQRQIVGALDAFEQSLLATERDNTGTDQAQASGFARTQQRLG